jgi:hypothetical protein
MSDGHVSLDMDMSYLTVDAPPLTQATSPAMSDNRDNRFVENILQIQ